MLDGDRAGPVSRRCLEECVFRSKANTDSAPSRPLSGPRSGIDSRLLKRRIDEPASPIPSRTLKGRWRRRDSASETARRMMSSPTPSLRSRGVITSPCGRRHPLLQRLDWPVLMVASWTSIDSWSLFLAAISRLLWPALALFVLIMFRREIGGLFSRRMHVSAGPIQADIDAAESIGEYKADTQRNSEEADNVPKQTRPQPEPEIADPSVRFVVTWAKIEREMRRIALLRTRTSRDFPGIPSGLPPRLRSAVNDLMSFHREIILGAAVPWDRASRMVDLADDLLDSLRDTPVVVGQVPLYRDEHATTELADFHGVRIQTTSPEDSLVYRVFPTTHDYKRPGPVSWDWERPGTKEPAWYRDPADTDVVVKAFDSSSAFAGKPL